VAEVISSDVSQDLLDTCRQLATDAGVLRRGLSAIKPT
jgi:hypothetical protein